MEWWQILIVAIFTEIFLNAFFGTYIYIFLYDKWYEFVPMPKDIKCHTDMNWFGSIVCYIFSFILFPVLNIGKVIYWLFHI